MTPAVFADGLSPILEPMRTYLRAAPDAQVLTGCVAAGHDPTVAPQYYSLLAWLPVTDPQVAAYEAAFQISIPPAYRDLLVHSNGLFHRRCDLYGIPLSMLASPPLLDRSNRQPLDLGAANFSWRLAFKNHGHLFHFGGFWYSRAESGGLFQAGNGHVIAVLKSGELLAEWPGYSELLSWVFSRPETGV